MKIWNKVMLFLTMCVMLVAPVMGAALCTESTTFTNGTLTGLFNVSTPIVHATNSEEQIGGIQEVMVTTATTLELCENHTITNGTSLKLMWVQTYDNVSVSNATLGTSYSDGLDIGGEDSNYTYNNATGVLIWNFSAGLEDGAIAQICYNVTLDVNEDITARGDNWTLYTLGSTSYGDDGNWTLMVFKLNNTDFDLNYSITTRDCSTAASCRATQGIIYAGFGLIALFAIIIAAFAIISVFQTGDMSAISITLVSSVIALGFIVLVGYVIIGYVGQTVCS